MAIKAKEIADKNSCLNKAAPDEPIFVLRAQDKRAPGLIRIWATEFAKVRGYNDPKYQDALDIADAMEAWPTRKLAD